MKRTVCFVLCLILLTSVFSGCGTSAITSGATTVTTTSAKPGSTAANTNPIKVAFVGPLTGDYSQYGKSFQSAINVAVEEVNAKGGVLGRKVQIVTFDDKNSSEEAGSIAERIVADKSICAVLGHFSSGVAMTAAKTYQENGIVLISASASHPDYSKIGDYIFRNNILIASEAANDIQIAVKSGVKKLGVIKVKTDWGQGAETALNNAMDQIKDRTDMKIVQVEEFVDGTVDFSSNITKFQQAGCDGIVVLGMYNALAPFAIQYRKVNKTSSIISVGSSYTKELINLAADSANGILFPAGIDPNSSDSKIKSYVDKYKKITNGLTPDNMSAQTYDNACIIFNSIANAKTDDRAAIRNEVQKTDLDGVSGRITFDKNGDAVKTQTLFVVKNNDFVTSPIKLDLWADFIASLKK